MIGVLGCGNMADAIVRGIHQFDKSISFLTYTPSKTRAHQGSSHNSPAKTRPHQRSSNHRPFIRIMTSSTSGVALRTNGTLRFLAEGTLPQQAPRLYLRKR